MTVVTICILLALANHLFRISQEIKMNKADWRNSLIFSIASLICAVQFCCVGIWDVFFTIRNKSQYTMLIPFALIVYIEIKFSTCMTLSLRRGMLINEILLTNATTAFYI